MRKKLIEVALPLEAINAESAREKSIRHGHPSTLHLWWARRPLAACRAVLWASLVDDPSSWPEKFPTEAEQTKERQRLFDILGRITIETDKKGNQKQVVRGLVSWDDIKDEQTINEAQREIARCLAWSRGEEPPTKPEAVRDYIAQHAPPVYDPFAGGGSIPLEAQRLGLEAHASDLNPVAVLINKALIEIPPRFKDCPPVNPDDRQRGKLESWKGAQGLAADVRYYGQWMRDEAFQRIGHLYPQVDLPEGGKATVIAWIWARTVRCPNPACGCQMPLVRSFKLSTKKGRQAWVEPIVENDGDTEETKIRFEVKTGEGQIPEGTLRTKKGGKCIACDTPVPLSYLRSEGKAGNISQQLMAIIAEGKKGRTYLSPNLEHETVETPECDFLNNIDLAKISGYLNPPIYGYETIGSMLTNRQRLMINTFSELMPEVKKIILQNGANKEYAESLCAYLTLAIGRVQNRSNGFAIWNNTGEKIEQAFSEQGVGMVWDFAEANPFSNSTGSWNGSLGWIPKCIEALPQGKGYVSQADAGNIVVHDSKFITSTDPPYYSSITYADFSDFFYGTFRKCLKADFSHLFSTLTTPKEEEIVAAWHRFNGDRNVAGQEFTRKLKKAIELIALRSVSDIPVTIYYAFKEKELNNENDGFVSAWDSILSVVNESGLRIVGTWPLRTERTTGRKEKKNALATSIVLTCRPRPETATQTTRRQFLSELKRELPKALKTLQQGNIAPVDLAQASIGPGMAIYSQYTAVLENDGSPMRVRTALQLINQILDEFLTEQEGEFDGDTRWALTWFEQYQFNPGQYGDAETLSKAKNTSVQGMVEAGIIEAKAGKVRLLKREELPTNWTPDSDTRMPDWELTQYLIRELDQNGEMGAAELLSKLGDRGEGTRDLAYRLYSLCERKNWAQDAIAYNSLVTAWPEITRLASEFQSQTSQQTTLDF